MCAVLNNNAEMTVFQRMKHYADAYSSNVAIEYTEGNDIIKVTYKQFFEDCCKAANYFFDNDISNAAIAFSGKNDYIQYVILYSSMFNGNIACPINPELPMDTITEVFQRRKPSIFIFDKDYSSLADVPSDACKLVLTKEELLRLIQTQSQEFEEKNKLSPRDTCINLLTSGTTGTPKIVELTHMLFAPHAADYKGHKLLAVMPMHHMGGIFHNSFMFSRGDTVCISSFVDIIKHIEIYKSDFIVAVPSLIKKLTKLDRAGIIDLSIFKSIGTFAAPPDLESYEYLKSKGLIMANIYGTSEVGGEFTAYGDVNASVLSIGKKSPYFDMRIDSNGELLIKGVTNMNGYFGDEKATKEVIKDGWYYTGDAAKIDEKGYYYITGRIRNVIVLSNGENISPEAIETKLSNCDSILMCQVKESNDKLMAEVFYGDVKMESVEKLITEYISDYNRSVPTIYRISKTVFRYSKFNTTQNGKLIRD